MQGKPGETTDRLLRWWKERQRGGDVDVDGGQGRVCDRCIMLISEASVCTIHTTHSHSLQAFVLDHLILSSSHPKDHRRHHLAHQVNNPGSAIRLC